jgi:hypothetical protein
MPLATSEFQNLVRRAEDGDFDAQCRLAELYHQGDGVPRNYVEAAKWYLPSAEHGNRDAQRGLGLLYLRGLGKKAEGIKLLQLAGNQGDGNACFLLAKTLSQASGQDRDPIGAYTWFCLAEAYGDDCEKEIHKLEYELSVEQILGAQLRAREEFRPPVVLSVAEAVEARRGEMDSAVQGTRREASTFRLGKLDGIE